MFTGLVECVGEVVSAAASDAGRRLVVDASQWAYRPEPGASVAVNGCCLTHAPREGDQPGLLAFDVVEQTLSQTTLGGLEAGSRVNLEPCLTPSSRMGGHFVQGHVDGVGRVARVERDSGYYVHVAVDESVLPCIVPTGSVAVQGVSLTVAEVDVAAATFKMALIPTTLELTTLGELRVGDEVNIETDMLVKSVLHYVQHFGMPAGLEERA